MLRRIAWIALLVVIALIGVLGLGLGAAQTGYVKGRLEELIESQLEGVDSRIKVSGLAGTLPFAPRLDRLTLADARGVWLEAEGLELDVAKRALVGGRLTLDSASARRVVLHRLPESAPADPAAPPFELTLPTLPESLPPVGIERLHVEQIDLAESVLGTAASFRLDGKALTSPDGQRLDAQLALARIDQVGADGPPASVSLQAALDLASGRLSTDLSARADDGLLAAALGRPDLGPATLRLSGDGPIEDWQGKLEAALENQGRVEGSVRLDLGTSPRVGLDLALLPAAGAVPANIAGLVGERADLVLQAASENGRQITIEQLRLTSPAVRLEGSGRVDPAASQLTGRLAGHINDLARLSPLAGTPLAGSARIDATAAGSPTRPVIELSLHGENVGAQDVTANALDLNLNTLWNAPGAGLDDKLTIVGQGRLEGIAQGGRPLPGLGTLEVQLNVHQQQHAPWRIEGLVVKAPELGAEAFAQLDLDPTSTAIDGRVALELRELSRLGKLVGTPLEGQLYVTVLPHGTLAQPFATLEAHGTGLQIGEARVDTLRLAGEVAAGDPGTAGRLSLILTHDAVRVDLGAAGSLTPERLLIETLKIHGPSLDLQGHGAVGLVSGLVDATLQGGSTDLSKLRTITGQPLAGTLDVDIALGHDEGRQNARVRLAARDLANAFGAIKSARVEADGKNLLGTARLQGEAVVEGFTSPDLTLERARVTANGSLDDLPVTVDLRGSRAGEAFSVASNGQLAIDGQTQRVRLETLKGAVAGQSVQLVQPTRLTMAPDLIELDHTEIRVGEIRARAEGSLKDGAVKAEIRVEPLPLTTLTPFGLPKLPGRGTATLTLSGRANAPDGQLSVELTGVGPPGASRSETRTDVVLRARLENGRTLHADTRLTGLGPQPLQGQMKLPVRLSLAPFAFDLANDAGLDGKVQGVVDLERIARLAPLDDQRLDGDLDLDLAVAGTLTSPAVTGRAQLRGGRVEDAGTGLVLRDIAATLAARDSRIIIERLTARDRNAGQVKATGEIDLASLGYKAEVTLTNLEALHNELGRAALSGTVQAEGSRDRAAVSGKLAVDRAELRVPDPSPAVPATIPVEEIGKGRRVAAPEPANGPPFELGLDVAVEMPGRIFVRGRGLDSEWGGNLKIGGTAAAPEVIGKIELRRGFIDLLDKRFQLREGTITFDGAQPPMPRIDIRASTQAGDITAIVRIQGRAPKLDITFESEPPMPRDEVLAYILFNKDLSSISPLQAARIASALLTLRGGEGFDALGKLRSATGLDTIDFGGQSAEDAGARVGKYLSDKVYLEVQKGLSPGSGKARVEVDLGNNLKGTTEVTENAQTGLRLEWKYDY